MGLERFRHARRIDADVVDFFHNDMTRLQRWDKGTANIIKDYGGGGSSGDDRILYPNIIDVYPRIELAGNGTAWLLGTATSDFQIKNATNLRLLVDGTNSNLAINGVGVSAHYDLGLFGDGILCLKEGATPTADANYGKLYCKNTNDLWFQDGAGVEHEVAFV